MIARLVPFMFIAPLFSWAQEKAADAPEGPPRAYIDGTGPGWEALGPEDFVDVNCGPETWSWSDGLLSCTGEPIGVIRTREPLENFELSLQWRHLKPGGNSGVFVWAKEASLEGLEPGQLPRGGIECQILDHAFKTQYEERTGETADWFTTNGDVFPVGTSTLEPFPPLSPNGSRSFPSEDRTHGAGTWNHYYIRCVNGEVRLWVNGKEVSGGSNANPSAGYLCLESEGSPIEFKDIKIRKLP